MNHFGSLGLKLKALKRRKPAPSAAEVKRRRERLLDHGVAMTELSFLISRLDKVTTPMTYSDDPQVYREALRALVGIRDTADRAVTTFPRWMID